MVKASGLAFQQRQIMQRFVVELLLAPVTFVPGNQLILEDQTHFIDGSHNGDLTICVLRRHRVTIAIKPDQRQRVRMCLHDSMSFKSLLRKREKEPLLFLAQQVFLRQGLAS